MPAIEAFTKAGEMDPKQHVIWGNLAEVYSEIAKTKTGAEKDAALAKSYENYKKAIELAPTDANYYNNYALALARGNKIPEMQEALNKAVELDPTNAGRYYYNLGAVLTNMGQTDPACNAFKKAIETDPNYADAHYQYGVCLTGKATAKPDGACHSRRNGAGIPEIPGTQARWSVRRTIQEHAANHGLQSRNHVHGARREETCRIS